MAVETGAIAEELRETLGRLIRRLRAEPGQLPVAQGTARFLPRERLGDRQACVRLGHRDETGKGVH